MKITNEQIVKIEYTEEELIKILKDYVQKTYSYEGEVTISFWKFIAQMIHNNNPLNDKEKPTLIINITKDLSNAN